MKTFDWRKAVFGGIVFLGLCVNAYATGIDKIESALEAARKELRISIATQEKIALDLAKLKRSGDASPDMVKDYQRYLSRVQDMVAEHRRKVAKIEALHARYDIRKAADGSAHGDNTEAMINPPIPEEQVVDEVVVLDRQLDSSLAQFDEMLLKELDLIRAKSSERMRDLAQEAAAAAQRLREQGIEINSGVEKGPVEAGQGPTQARKTIEMGKEASETGKDNKSDQDKDDRKWTARNPSREGVEGSADHPKNRYDPEDDDIVARQLRQAAEQETDPELRKKLWKEYENYKQK